MLVVQVVMYENQGMYVRSEKWTYELLREELIYHNLLISLSVFFHYNRQILELTYGKVVLP